METHANLLATVRGSSFRAASPARTPRIRLAPRPVGTLPERRHVLAQTRSTAIGVSDTGEAIDQRDDARTGQAYETVGVRFRFSDHWNTSLQFDRTAVGEKSRTGKAVMIAFTLGAQYRC